MENKLKLYGFNNLTKALSFNIYDVCYAKTEREQLDYIKYIDQQYNSERLTGIMEKLTEMIGAHVLHISKQDYDPQGASVTFLIAEEHMKPALEPDTIVAHLDKSHVTVHTYPEYHPDTCLATFRVDIDVATCGEITPPKNGKITTPPCTCPERTRSAPQSAYSSKYIGLWAKRRLNAFLSQMPSCSVRYHFFIGTFLKRL